MPLQPEEFVHVRAVSLIKVDVGGDYLAHIFVVTRLAHFTHGSVFVEYALLVGFEAVRDLALRAGLFVVATPERVHDLDEFVGTVTLNPFFLALARDTLSYLE